VDLELRFRCQTAPCSTLLIVAVRKATAWAKDLNFGWSVTRSTLTHSLPPNAELISGAAYYQAAMIPYGALTRSKFGKHVLNPTLAQTHQAPSFKLTQRSMVNLTRHINATSDSASRSHRQSRIFHRWNRSFLPVSDFLAPALTSYAFTMIRPYGAPYGNLLNHNRFAMRGRRREALC
jgi:hypothetical protein